MIVYLIMQVEIINGKEKRRVETSLPGIDSYYTEFEAISQEKGE